MKQIGNYELKDSNSGISKLEELHPLDNQCLKEKSNKLKPALISSSSQLMLIPMISLIYHPSVGRCLSESTVFLGRKFPDRSIGRKVSIVWPVPFVSTFIFQALSVTLNILVFWGVSHNETCM